MIVIDSSVSLKWVLPEVHSAKAIRLRDDFQSRLIELIAPDVFPVENLHALAKAERQRRIAFGTALPLWQSVLADCPVLHANLPLLDRAYQIASKAHIGIYDCLYVALAERESCELATADDRLLNSLQAQFPFVRHVSTYP